MTKPFWNDPNSGKREWLDWRTLTPPQTEKKESATMQVTLSVERYGYLLTADNGESIYIQTDWDYPGTAANLGFVPCECGMTDGTVNCQHKTAAQMIAEAADFLDTHDGESFDDPGYFS